ncbi:hypothetical protein Cs7R123_14630 [Catellatospora sp. TT07R-123]|uniref:hypothetical protein n=1 Tax=Catellatospora sp. TT07R-123 TaxID=2733863 RepID=UPI001B28D9C0|nr:hypothetical protein [Catellatospora sp. TT07R-123]GHJ44121.1 hypothetical protein Cs7R123_14630 [Catellatospora sp. TT07R-123]
MPRVAVTGHRDLTPEVARYVTDGLRAVLRPYGPLVGLSCLADGADQLFAQIIVELGGVVEVVVPAADYRRHLSATAAARYDVLLAGAAAVHRMPAAVSGEQAYQRANEFLVRGCELLVAVWDGEPARGHGGTADAVAYARELGVAVKVVWPPGVRRA